MLTKRIEPHVASFARQTRKATQQATKTARKTVKEHPLAVIAGVLVLIVALVITISILKAIVKRRRRTLFQRTLGYLDDLGEHRDRIAERLRELVEKNVDGGAIGKDVSRRVKAVKHELQAVDQVIESFNAQGERLAEQVRR